MSHEMMYEEFREAGYRFFGLKGVTDGACNCGNPNCEALFKHPWFNGWQHSPVWSDEQLEVMQEAGQLDHGYGVILDGLLVVDVDAKNGGVKSYEKLVEAIPEIMGSGFIVNTGSGKGSKHLYFTIPTGLSLRMAHEKYKGIDFKSSGYVVGPGSMHISGNRYEAVVGTPYDIGPAPQALLDLLARPEFYRATFEGMAFDLKDSDIAQMLSYIRNDDLDYQTWINIGMAIHDATGGAGLELWDAWSATLKSGTKQYSGIEYAQKKWHSFGKNAHGITAGTLFYHAKAGGWSAPVTFDAGNLFADYPDTVIEAPVEDDTQSIQAPFSTDGVDLLRPPGFVGEVTKWLNTQGNKLREHIAVATALTSIGNIAGLRYQGDETGMRLNLFTFCVAGSGTGKEAMLAGFTALHYAAKVTRAVHGNFKSEQELISNIIHHQAAYYAVDEIGTVLAKVENARKKGGAAYLDGLVGQLMSIFSKSNGRFLLTGDKGREVVEILSKEAARIQKKVDENENLAINQPMLDSLLRQLETIHDGILDPFLSMIGFTTPETFNGLVTPEFVKNGFMSRALFFEEPDTNPRPKKLHKKPPMPESIKNTLLSLACGGNYDVTRKRIETVGELTTIATTEDAQAMLEGVSEYFWELGEQYKATNGFEAIATRGYELTAKVSAILAVASGVRTVEHVRWAFALVKRDLDKKAMLAFTNEDKSESRPEDETRKLAARILGRITPDHGETVAVLRNRIRGTDEKTMIETLAIMEKNGLVVKKEVKSKTQTAEKWFSV